MVLPQMHHLMRHGGDDLDQWPVVKPCRVKSDLVGRPVNSLLDEVLEPVDRDVFRRQNRYFEALQPNEAAPAGKPEK